MEQHTTVRRTKQNWLLMGAAFLFVALAVVLCILIRPKAGEEEVFRVRFGDDQSIDYPANEAARIVIRNGVLSDTETGDGEENIIRIENGAAWMESANCPNHECVEQGRLDANTVQTRPLGTWIVCAPHGVSIEYIGEAP